MMEWYGVVGHPILHSLSPNIFRRWFESRGTEHLGYVRFSAVQLSDVLALADQLHLRGLNVTSPFKQEAAKAASSLDEVVRRLDAANTLWLSSAGWHAANTDPEGILEPIGRRGIQLENRDCLVVGAGGAARAAVYALNRAGAYIRVMNRHISRAEGLTQIAPVTLVPEGKPVPTADVVVWTIPAYPPEWSMKHLDPDTVVLDANYRIRPPQGYFGNAVVVDGTEWLVAQGVASYRQWFQRVPEPARPPDGPTWSAWCSHQSNLLTKRPLVLTGFMGSGKTSVAAALAEMLGCCWADTDQVVMERSGKPIPEIFEREGEARFREMERDAFHELVQRDTPIIACGGGLPIQPGMAQFLMQHCLTVCLSRSLALLNVDLLQQSRPLLTRQSVYELFDKRRDLYLATSDIVVACGAHDPATLSRLLVRELDGGRISRTSPWSLKKKY